MESRYVYRCIEDAIGTPLPEPCPHTSITSILRMRYRESRDVYAFSVAQASCLAAIAGNPSISAAKTGENAFGMLAAAKLILMPYMEKSEASSEDEETSKYEKYFDLLRKLDADKAKEGKTDTAESGKI